MNFFILNIGLALVWMLITGQFTPTNLVAGFIVGYVALFLGRRVIGPSAYFGKVWQILSFLIFVLREIVEANMRLAIDVLTPGYHMQPRVMAVPLDVRTDAEITLLANLITLTPGSVSLDISSDRRTLYVHVMYAQDEEAARRQIKEGLEQRVLNLMRHTSQPALDDMPLREETKHAD